MKDVRSQLRKIYTQAGRVESTIQASKNQLADLRSLIDELEVELKSTKARTKSEANKKAVSKPNPIPRPKKLQKEFNKLSFEERLEFMEKHAKRKR